MSDSQEKNNITVVIFDLDNIIWNGMLLESEVSLNTHVIELIKKLKSLNIKVAVAANTNEAEALARLKALGVYELFYEAHIGYRRVYSMVSHMIIRNHFLKREVLYITGNPIRRAEVEWKNKGIHTSSAENMISCLNDIINNGMPQVETRKPPKYFFRQPEDHDYTFDMLAAVTVDVEFDIEKHFEQIYEVLNESVQLNFTKNKVSDGYLEMLVGSKKHKYGAVFVKTRFFERRFAGFYCLNKETNEAEQLAFCFDIFGLCVEQFIYATLGFPEIKLASLASISDQTANILNTFETPFWINKATNNKIKIKTLLKGHCDLIQAIFFLDRNKYDYTREEIALNEYGVRVASLHLNTLRAIIDLSESEKAEIAGKFPICSRKIYDTILFDGEYDIAILSLESNYSREVYYNKQHKIKQEIGMFYWDDTVYRKMYESECKDEPYGSFEEYWAAHYENCGYVSPDEFADNLEYVMRHIKKPVIFLNVPEIELPHLNDNNFYERCKKMNAKLDEYMKTADNRYLVDMRKYVKSIDQLSDIATHYDRHAFAWMSSEIERIVSSLFY